ncbi:MAG: hypothetical protein HC821_04730, partial [Lewinella sp.]|nr:hypothetical protein [Lewinella sp.]
MAHFYRFCNRLLLVFSISILNEWRLLHANFVVSLKGNVKKDKLPNGHLARNRSSFLGFMSLLKPALTCLTLALGLFAFPQQGQAQNPFAAMTDINILAESNITSTAGDI